MKGEHLAKAATTIITIAVALVLVLATVYLVSTHSIGLSLVLLPLGLFLLFRLCRCKTCRYPGLINYNRIWLFASVLIYIWFMGFSFYYVALSKTLKEPCLTELVARSVTRSALMFVSGVDSNIISDIHNLMEQRENTMLAACLACTAAIAVVFTFVFLITIFFSRLKSYLHLLRHSIWGKYDRLYIFFGFNKQNIALANSINKDEKQKFRIVFVEKQLSEIENETSGWKSLLSTFTHRVETFKNARMLNADFAVMNDNFTARMTDCHCENGYDILGMIGLSSIKRIINRRMEATSEIHVFCLADNENRLENIHATTALQKDKTLISFAGAKGDTLQNDEKGNRKAIIHCLARYNSINRVLEDIDLHRKVEVKIVDPSHLSIELLKREVIHQPISYVDIDHSANPGTVTSSFNSLVIGFSETGKDAVRFLYEFGAFVDARSSSETSARSTFYCHVVDNRMDKLKGPFISSAPSVFDKRNWSSGESPINLHNMEYDSDEFFNGLLPSLSPLLNYVVIAIGDDEAGMTLAVRILKYMMRSDRFKDGRFEHFRIYVRSYEPELHFHLKRIADHYNEGEERIHVFGAMEDIFSYNVIVKDEFEEMGKNFYNAYHDVSEPGKKESWEQRRRNCIHKKKADSTLLERLQKIRRQESQDKANALHAATKLFICNEVLGADGVTSLTSKILVQTPEGKRKPTRFGKYSHISYPGLSPLEESLMLNLAKTEHLRWNEAHELMGYTENTNEHQCNETTMQHNCLKPWEKLDKESDDYNKTKEKPEENVDYKSYDFAVVETTLEMTIEQ